VTRLRLPVASDGNLPSYDECECVVGHRCDCWDYREPGDPSTRDRIYDDGYRSGLAAAAGSFDVERLVFYRDDDPAITPEPTPSEREVVQHTAHPLPWSAETYRSALLELLEAARRLQPYRASPPEYPGLVLVPLEEMQRLGAHVTSLGNPDDYAYPEGMETPETRRLRRSRQFRGRLAATGAEPGPNPNDSDDPRRWSDDYAAEYARAVASDRGDVWTDEQVAAFVVDLRRHYLAPGVLHGAEWALRRVKEKLTWRAGGPPGVRIDYHQAMLAVEAIEAEYAALLDAAAEGET
jgi:hypothetical protein